MDSDGLMDDDEEENMIERLRNAVASTGQLDDESLGNEATPIFDDQELESQNESWDFVETNLDINVSKMQEEAVGEVHYQSALRTAVASTRSFDSGLKQPWERGPMKFLFGNSLELGVPLTMAHAPPQSGSASGSQDVCTSVGPDAKKIKLSNLKEISFIHCVKQRPDQHYLEKMNADKKLAIGKVFSVLSICPDAFSLGRTVLEEADAEDFELAMLETLEIVLLMKSPKTIGKRAGSMLMYLKWFSDSQRGLAFPIKEKDVAAYLFNLRRSGEYISRGSSFREALRFCHYFLGLDGAIEACDSPRVRGVSDMMLTSGGAWTPADPFLVSEVIGFHQVLESEDKHILDRMAAGNVLVMIYGRCRASDLAYIKTVKLDFDESSGYLEFGTQHHKTSRKAALKMKLLPIVLPVMGITGQNWVKTLLALRRTAGLACDDLYDAPWWPAPQSIEGDNIVWGVRPVSSDEISSWMNSCVESSKGDRHIGSHSAKATCLSWLSKAGIAREDRDVLGRHVTALHESAPLYARDLLASPLRKLDDTILQIFNKQFLPDQNRSGMFTPVVAAPATPAVAGSESNRKADVAASVVEVKTETSQEPTLVCDSAEEVIDSEQTHSENESGKSLESDDEDEQLQVISVESYFNPPMPILKSEGMMFFMHKKSKICHVRDKALTPGDGPNFLECGRKLSENFSEIPSISSSCFRCSLCFKGRR